MYPLAPSLLVYPLARYAGSMELGGRHQRRWLSIWKQE
jgi:hypothetical protein